MSTSYASDLRTLSACLADESGNPPVIDPYGGDMTPDEIIDAEAALYSELIRWLTSRSGSTAPKGQPWGAIVADLATSIRARHQ